MVDIPEHLLLKTAEARAKALGISVEQALAEMRGEAEPTKIEKEPDVIEVTPIEVEVKETPAPSAEVKETPAQAAAVKETPAPSAEVKETPAPSAEVKEKPAPAAAVKEAPAPAPEKSNGQVPTEVDFAPETKVTQRLLTVVKAKPIQKPTSEPVDKVNTWPHLMLPEFISLMAMTAFLIFISAILSLIHISEPTRPR